MSESNLKHPDHPVNENEVIGQSGGHTVPSVEIFSNQLPFNIHPGQTKHITLTGSIYDHHFTGTVKVDPNGPISSACPIFATPLNGTQNVSLPIGANQAIITVVFTCPPNTPHGQYNCAMRYKAIQTNGNVSVGKGNEIDISYNVQPN